jgi:hypothetical protein
VNNIVSLAQFPMGLVGHRGAQTLLSYAASDGCFFCGAI